MRAIPTAACCNVAGQSDEKYSSWGWQWKAKARSRQRQEGNLELLPQSSPCIFEINSPLSLLPPPSAPHAWGEHFALLQICLSQHHLYCLPFYRQHCWTEAKIMWTYLRPSHLLTHQVACSKRLPRQSQREPLRQLPSTTGRSLSMQIHRYYSRLLRLRSSSHH